MKSSFETTPPPTNGTFLGLMYHGPPNPTFLEVFMVNNLVFRWPKPLFFMVKRGFMLFKTPPKKKTYMGLTSKSPVAKRNGVPNETTRRRISPQIEFLVWKNAIRSHQFLISEALRSCSQGARKKSFLPEVESETSLETTGKPKIHSTLPDDSIRPEFSLEKMQCKMEDAGVQRYTDLSTLKSFGKSDPKMRFDQIVKELC